VTSRYEALKVLQLTTARTEHVCQRCGAQIARGARYYRESLGLVCKPPGMRLKAYCEPCGTTVGQRPQ